MRTVEEEKKKNVKKISIRPATYDDATFVAWGMFAALGGDFEKTDEKERFLDLVRRDDVLYSWKNSLVACDAEGRAAGVIISYNGKGYSLMRRKTFSFLKKFMEIPFENMEDETKEGEYYIDSVAVLPEMRGTGIGRMLLEAAIELARKEDVGSIVLAVDPDNEKAQHLYRSIGFGPDGTLSIFGGVYYRWTIVVAGGVVEERNL